VGDGIRWTWENAVMRYVAFLRGINVGGHRVKMEHLRDLFTALRFSQVATFIASGNVIYDFRFHGRELYWLCRGRFSDSKVNWRLVEKTVTSPSTLRNVTMLRKLAAMYPPE
jgi:uncharacterized protein (DUF1697 family)